MIRDRATLSIALCWALGWGLFVPPLAADDLQTGTPAQSGDNRDDDAWVPAVLRPWIPWVLGDEDRRACPLDPQTLTKPAAPAAVDARQCAWPGRLYLDLDAHGGRFAQHWELYAESWVPLPGDGATWPQETRSGQTPVPVVLREGAPALKLPPGSHAISGRFSWQSPPEGLTLPPDTGLVALMIDGAPVPMPRVERGGRLWIGDPKAAGGEDEDRLAIQVFRKIDDDLPLRVTTRLELDVAGRARVLAIGPVLLPGGVPLRLESLLPARLDQGGRIQLQVRPGHWVVEIEAHHPGDVMALARPSSEAPWPDLELWSFAARPGLRRVELSGLTAVDPGQSGVPVQWSRLPTYRVGPGESMVFAVRQRGDADPGPSRLDLSRDLWLDFDGVGYSVRDRLSGQVTSGWRLDLRAPLTLGQIKVDGEPRLITRLAPADPPGVEVRQGRIQLTADSRLEDETTGLPVSGWNVELGSIRSRLHLPPGWDLLAVSGVDNIAASWLARWTLLDLFLVLIFALGVSRLWGLGWGLLAALTMALTWQAAEAPRLVWLHLLAAAALLRLMPQQPGRPGMARLRGLVRWYFRLSLLVLLLLGLPFLAGQVREGLWPQLERPWTDLGRSSGVGVKTPIADSLSQLPAARQSGETVSRDKLGAAAGKAIVPAPPLDALDPGAPVQSGLGVPDWDWATFELAWTGPVQPDEGVRLWLLTPFWHLLWSVAGAVLVALLALRLGGLIGSGETGAWRSQARPEPIDEFSLDLSDPPDDPPSGPGIVARSLLLLVLLPLLVGLNPGDAQADSLPTPELLDQLKARVLEPPDCLPQCVEIPSLTLEARSDRLRLVLTLDAAAHVSVPIPGQRGAWLPSELLLDGEPLDGMRRDAGDRLLVAVTPGRHQLELAGALPDRAELEIPFPLPPRLMGVDLEGWTLEGLDASARPGTQIRLVRLAGTQAQSEGPPVQGPLPPLLMVERLLRLGIDWRVEIRVRRLSPPESPVVLPVPLLPGESVQTPGSQVQDGKILVSLAPGQAETRWVSTLEPAGRLTLTADSDPRIVETWSLDLSPRWHLTWDGVTPVQQISDSDRWLPTWRPLPGETLTLGITRPEAVPGPTLTLDRVDFAVRPGRRASESELGLSLRSTQGGTHAIRLPEGAVPLRLLVDGQERPLPAAGAPLELALVPGSQSVALTWREARPLGARLRTRGPDLGSPAVNLNLSLTLPQDRWVLFTQGPRMGPVVLIWGVLLVLAGLALALGRVGLTPLKTRDWLLLGVGLALAEIWVVLLVSGWLFALAWRHRTDAKGPRWRYNAIQLGLVVLTLAALAGLIAAVSQGLLGRPDMQIMGNGSHGGLLNWYQDRGGPGLPELSVVSVPMWVYRALMLAWALWLAVRLLDWLRWGWDGFSRPVLWREGAGAGMAGRRR